MKITANMKTDWYPRDSNPVRAGLYETRIDCNDDIGVLRQWTGVCWILPLQNAECAVQRRGWRGLTEEGILRTQWPYPVK
jgi:hypothetical protein